jgi:hypothetical protein
VEGQKSSGQDEGGLDYGVASEGEAAVKDGRTRREGIRRLQQTYTCWANDQLGQVQ